MVLFLFTFFVNGKLVRETLNMNYTDTNSIL